MDISFSFNLGKPHQPRESQETSALPPSAAGPQVAAIEVAPSVKSETVSTLFEVAKAMPQMPAMFAKAQLRGQIAAISNEGAGAWQPSFPFPVLRGLADNADLIRSAIEATKKVVTAQDWEIATDEGVDLNPDASKLIESPDQKNDWDIWASMVLEEILACDNLCLFPWWQGGRVVRCEVLDGDTITPKPDDLGRIPDHPADAFEQRTIRGMKRFSTETLWYLPQCRRAKTLRGFSPVERLVFRSTINLWKLLKDLGRWTEGGVPPALLMVTGMEADQARALQSVLDDRAKDPKFESRQQIVPGDKVFFPPQIKIDKEHEEMLIRAIFYAFGIDPTAMISQVNYSTADALERWASLTGQYPHLYALRAIANKLLRYAGFSGHRLEWKTKRDADALAQKRARLDDYKAGLLSWEAMRAAENQPVEPGEIESEHYFTDGILNPFDPLAKKKEPPPGLGWPFAFPKQDEPANQPKPPAKASEGEPAQDPAAMKAELAKWQSIVKKAISAGKQPKAFKSTVLSKALHFRIDRAIKEGCGLKAFSKATPTKDDVKTWDSSARAQRAIAAIVEAIGPWYESVIAAAKDEALAEFKTVQKATGWSDWTPAPSQETWRAFLAALKAAYEAGIDDSGDIVGYGAIGDAAAIYARERAGLLLGRTWDEATAMWVDQPMTSKWYLPDTIRDLARTQVETAISEGWSVGDLTAKLDEVLDTPSRGVSRALMVARTETADSYNIGTAANYAAQGVEVVEVLDGGEGFNCECSAVNGQIWLVSTSMSRPTAHPNCTRAFLPRPDLTAQDAVA